MLDGWPPKPETDFFDAGGTSIQAVQFAAAIQETLGVAVEVVPLRKFGEIASIVGQRLDDLA